MSVGYKDENGILQKGAGLYKSEVPIGIADIYTEGERQVGLWIDGKPLYQRTFDLGSDVGITNNAFTNTTIDASSMETLVDAKAIYSTGVTRYNVMANISNGVIRLQADRNDTGINARYIVLQYTKTADSSTGVLPKSASALYLLGDVEISNLQDGDVLKYDDDDNKWKNGVGGGGGNANIWTGTQAELEEVFDELEEGTQINITDDEQEVVEGGTIYSEDEQVIGLWTDNKPLYQKTIFKTGTLATGQFISEDVSDLNIDTFVDLEGWAERYVESNQATIYYPLNYNEGNYAVVSRYNPDSETIDIRCTYSSGNLCRSQKITFKYTKTTDAPLDAVVGKKTMYIASSDCYSTEEKEIGVFADGKPLYQKTWTGLNVTPAYNNWTNIISNDDNIEKIVKWSALSGEDYKNIEGSGLEIQATSSYIRAEYNQNANVRTINVLTLQYTKTTDTAGSGSYTPASGKAVHYSTDEQVIGTWIDGKTLYSKTIDIGALPSSATSKTYAHGITGNIVRYNISAIDAGGTVIQLPFYTTATNYNIGVYVTNTNIVVETQRDSSGYTHCYATLEYTKSV